MITPAPFWNNHTQAFYRGNIVLDLLQHRIAMAAGREPADLLITNVRFLDVFSGELRREDVAIGTGVIVGFGPREAKETFDAGGKILLPGLIDAHIHIESSMLSPARFAELVLPHGTTCVVADPHEIANVAGTEGIRYFLDCARSLPLGIRLAIPSCVPAAPFEDAGAELPAETIKPFMKEPETASLGEMMNFPGVLGGDGDTLKKILAAREAGLGVDGHAPGVLGRGLDAYTVTGIGNTHECPSKEDALENLARGAYIFIREGSAAKNLKALLPCVTPLNARRFALCTDDRHAEDLIREGHMDHILRLAVAQGLPPVGAVIMCTLNAAEAQGLKGKGAIAPGWDADLILVDDMQNFTVRRTWVGGRLAAMDGYVLQPLKGPDASALCQSVRTAPLEPKDLELAIPSGKARVIRLSPGSLLTYSLICDVACDSEGRFAPEKNPEICQVAVIERHKASGKIGLGLLAGYGLRGGAIACTIAHDSHNIVVAGDSKAAMHAAVEELIRIQGGCAVCVGSRVAGSLPLPLGGLMSEDDPRKVSQTLAKLNSLAHEALHIPQDVDPFMTLSFMALPVIPSLKITARGLFDVDRFTFTSVDAGKA
ncbi:MAG: adenine deaminase [Desulfovibrionaceae bacterium]|nr:adenine deaminase [Desulfovibrionaceae bacterium]MBR5734711.1 adenine deaminase [Desulfovibrionaceae bacterium]